jgi:hypothetical protein
MRKILSAVALALVVGSPALAKDDSTFYGRIVHVSTDNIKVQNKAGQTLSFLILPKFKNVWSDDGKTTYQMSFLHNGTPVEILYDQSVLGARHADKIIVLRHLPM